MRKKTKLRIEKIKLKYPNLEDKIILEIYNIGFQEGKIEELNKLATFDKIDNAKQFMDSIFKSGFLCGRIKS